MELNKQARLGRRLQSGFTLMELLVVLAILGLLMALVGPNVLNQLGGAKTKTAGIQIKDLEQALEMYKLDVGRYPSTQEGLEALVSKPGSITGWNGPYLKSDVPMDPWNRPYNYKYPGDNAEVDIFTYGANGTPGGEGEDRDVGNWKQ
ncbi:type II secretion system protein GspG [Halioglobus japonicus]|uniref:Type II secretion system core protein G n=1 Tax=Halioglobus japonicus TaxID=930805 RepID=A0AAP8MED6_9GAMM|nr:type II secretion system major pseudopilin GspG [Halioglobus japonicus]AQA18279.1 type II secretion system protein GspG [Halioglobus japonicus]PLW86291.1 type II secretion system protein GspG [Halioglobus japonicus]GHD13570.1 type II secretion system protein GspG [Halioglobus japonicus]